MGMPGWPSSCVGSCAALRTSRTRAFWDRLTTGPGGIQYRNRTIDIQYTIVSIKYIIYKYANKYYYFKSFYMNNLQINIRRFRSIWHSRCYSPLPCRLGDFRPGEQGCVKYVENQKVVIIV